MQSDSTIKLSTAQNLIITLLSKAKPDFPFEIVQNDNGVPELVMEYGIVTDIPENIDPELIANEPRKYNIPLDEQATWVKVKKMVDFFEKYLKNANLNKNPTHSHDKPIA
jgi:hypothetical protein